MIHITNGDAAVHAMNRAGISGEFLPWRDALHEGPVPFGLSLQEMSSVRARFIVSDLGWGDPDRILRSFISRDHTLENFTRHEEAVLWFEHDLYDQLQLLQILDWFQDRDLGETRLSLVCRDEFLGPMAPERFVTLFLQRVSVTPEQMQLATRAWKAFSSSDPTEWQRLSEGDTAPLPFLVGAVLRHLEQYPSRQNGTNRTENEILRQVAGGISRPGELFVAVQETEERPFMGDSIFWIYLNGLVRGPSSLLRLAGDAPFHLPSSRIGMDEFNRQEFSLTERGRSVLADRLDWAAGRDWDKWLGGVHLTPENLWRWDRTNRRLIPPSA